MKGCIVSHTIGARSLSKGLHIYHDHRLGIIRDIYDDRVVISSDINSSAFEVLSLHVLRSLYIKDSITEACVPLSYLDWKKSVDLNLVDEKVEIDYMTHSLTGYTQEATLDFVGYNENILENIEGQFFFTEEDLLRAYEAGEYKIEYPKTAPNFNRFLNTLKNNKGGRKEIAS